MINRHIHTYAFLKPDSRLLPEQIIFIMDEAYNMYIKNEEKRNIKSDSFEGILWTKGEYETFASIGGQRFYAELEVEGIIGKSNIRFLVDELPNYGRTELSDELN